MSTIAEIREAIRKLSPEEQSLLAAEIFANIPLPHEDDPAFLAKLDESLASAEQGPTYTVEEVDAMFSKRISKSPTPKAP